MHGVGVFETLKEISRLALNSVRTRIAEESRRQGVAGVLVPAMTPSLKAATRSAASARAAASAEAPTDPALMEPLRVEFAEEDTDKVKVRAVRTKGSIDITQELEKLRALTTDRKVKTPTAVRDRDADVLVTGTGPADRDASQEVTRKTALEVPEHLLKGLTDLRIHLGFDRDGREEILRDAVRVTLVGTRRLQKLSVHLDLDLKGKD